MADYEGFSPSAIGNRLRLAREARGLKQVEVAARAGWDQQRLSNYENGRRTPDRAAARALRRILGVSLDYIFEGSTELLPHEIALELQKRLREDETGGKPSKLRAL